MAASMKPFRKHYLEFSKRKIKQKSLRDAIKIADQREQDHENGVGPKAYKSETDSIIEDEEEESESDKSKKSAHSKHSRKPKKPRHEEEKQSKAETDKEESKQEVVSEKPHLVETPVKLKNLSNDSEVAMDESESGDEESSKPKELKQVMYKSPKVDDSISLKRIKRKVPNTSILNTKAKIRKPIIQKSENSDNSMSDNFQQKDSIKANNLIKAASRKKLNNYLQEVALIRTKLDNVLKEKFTVTDLAANENSDKILSDLKYLDYLYTERIQDTAKVHTLCKTGISKTLHKFQRY
jgi:hypothetical protein